MTSLEIVKRTIKFQRPERLAIEFDLLGRNDRIGIRPTPPEGVVWTGTGIDPWGCRWAQSEVVNMGTLVGHPLTDPAQIDRHPVPDFTQDHWWVGVEETIAQAEREQRYVTGGIFMILFERMHALCGLETVLMGLLTDRPAMERVADRIVEVQLTLLEQYRLRFGGRIHGISMSDDWGTQNQSFVKLALWMDFFAPRYKRLFDAMHAAGFDVWLHSCGKVNELIEGFIRVGVDVVNLQQPRALGIEEIGKKYRGRISFSSLADIQSTLPTGRADLIEADAEALAANWMLPTGGFVFSDYGDGEAIGTADASKLIMYRKFSEISERMYGNPLPEPILPKK
jgi:hypothetical protein